MVAWPQEDAWPWSGIKESDILPKRSLVLLHSQVKKQLLCWKELFLSFVSFFYSFFFFLPLTPSFLGFGLRVSLRI